MRLEPLRYLLKPFTFFLRGELTGFASEVYFFIIPRQRYKLPWGDSFFDMRLYADCRHRADPLPCVARPAVVHLAPCPADAFKLGESTLAEIIVRHADAAYGHS